MNQPNAASIAPGLTDLDRAVEIGSTFAADLGRAIAWHRWLVVGVAVGAMLTAYGALQFVRCRQQVDRRQRGLELHQPVEVGTIRCSSSTTNTSPAPGCW